ncbi:MAG: transcriptional regulator [Rhodothermaceae bacterium]|nr:MAG: transcriptional regulator [Rhodothermaceae bacterium]
MKDLPVDLLRSFVTIAEVGSFSRAAEQLYRTQPALSLQIKRLEEMAGVKLLERTGRQVRVTEAGQVLLTYARRILDLHEEALARLSVVDTEGAVRVGVLEEVALGPLVDLLTKFGRLCTKIQIELVVATSWDLARAIRENRLGLAVANRAYATDETDIQPLWEEEYVWATHPDYDFLDEDPLPLILDPLDCPWNVRDRVLAALDAQGRAWRIVFSSLSLSAQQAAVRAGLGLGLLARSALTPDVRVLPPEAGLPAAPTAEIALYRAANATSPACERLAEFLLTHLRAAPGTTPLDTPFRSLTIGG